MQFSWKATLPLWKLRCRVANTLKIDDADRVRLSWKFGPGLDDWKEVDYEVSLVEISCTVGASSVEAPAIQSIAAAAAAFASATLLLSGNVLCEPQCILNSVPLSHHKIACLPATRCPR